MADPRITIRLSARYAALLALNADGWLDAGACEDGLEPEEREALHSTYTQIVRGLKRHGLTLSVARTRVDGAGASPRKSVAATDLVDRLRTKHVYGALEIEQQRREAADEIERLRETAGASVGKP